ncbi:MAG: hypothetical protein IKW98_02765 [Prevotella sp.]|nr:hypothetical protein [Prevotella sp.]
MEKERLVIYKVRTFGDKLNVTFDFIRENWRPMLKYMTYMMLPLACVLGVTLSKFMTIYTKLLVDKQTPDSYAGIAISYGLTILLYVFATLLLSTIVYSLMRIYQERKNRLEDLTYAELKPTFWRMFKRMLILGLVFLVLYVLAIVLMIGLAALSPWTLLLTIPALLVCIVPLAYWTPSYMFEDISVFAAFEKSYRLGFPTWGGIVLIIIVLGFLSTAISSIASIPWSIGLVVFTMLSESGDGNVPVLMEFLMYLLTVVQAYCTLVVSSLGLVGMAFQYGHAADKIDGITMDRNIKNFEQLGDDNIDAPDVMEMDNEFDDFDKL